MHKLSIKYLRPGMITGQSVYHLNGTFLLTRGTLLTEAYIERLKTLGITSIYVTSVNTALHIEPTADILQEQTRVRAIKDIYDTFKKCRLTNTVDMKLLKNTVNAIVRDLTENEKNLVQVSDIRLHDTYTFSHCVNVSVLAAMLATKLEFSPKRLKEITLGGLLHDIGKIETPNTILNKPGALTPSEMAIVRMHPEDGFRILSLSNQFSPEIMHIAFEHHEKMDGSGYPRNLSKDDIHEFSRIVAIADVYDALTSERAYKKPYKPHLAYNIMTKCSAGHFDADFLKVFFENIAIYQIGTILHISYGYAIVTKINQGNTLRPIIHLFADNNKKLLPKPIHIDLSMEERININHELDEIQLIDLINATKTDPAQFLTDE